VKSTELYLQRLPLLPLYVVSVQLVVVLRQRQVGVAAEQVQVVSVHDEAVRAQLWKWAIFQTLEPPML
jgi:hypothetical protein